MKLTLGTAGSRAAVQANLACTVAHHSSALSRSARSNRHRVSRRFGQHFSRSYE